MIIKLDYEKFRQTHLFVLLSALLISVSSRNDKKGEDTILKGKVTILVDETLKPIIDDQVAVFESNMICD
jgi:phosphate transport system substrate-binding protein